MGGFNKVLLTERFNDLGYQAEYIQFADVDFKSDRFDGQLVNYTSSEDKGFHYKDFIEDIVLGLQLKGAIVIPDHRFLRANNNKVFMEILRDQSDYQDMHSIESKKFGNLRELKERAEEGKFVIKQAAGAMSKGVMLAENKKELIGNARKITRTRYCWAELWDLKNKIKHKGYRMDSRHRKKFIIQNFIEGLDRDWKVLIYGNRYYILERKTRKNDFRASGSGMFSYTKELPEGILDFASAVYESMNVPHLSMDIAFDGSTFYLLEFQAVFFGSKTLEWSEFYFMPGEKEWEIVEERSELEKVYAESIDMHVRINKI